MRKSEFVGLSHFFLSAKQNMLAFEDNILYNKNERVVKIK